MKYKSRTFYPAAFFVAASAFGQTKPITLSVDDPRPLAAACDALEKLSSIAIDYEDPQFSFAADLQDVTASVLTPSQKAAAGNSFHLIVPRGGRLSVDFQADEATGRLLTIPSVTAAANALVAAGTSALSQEFEVKLVNGVPLVVPSLIRNKVGVPTEVAPILSSRISFPEGVRSGFVTLKLVLQLVSENTGFRIGLGTMPLRAFANSDVNIGANNEAASTVLSRLFQSLNLTGCSGTPRAVPQLSYRLFYDPGSNAFALNIHFVVDPTILLTGPPPAVSATGNSAAFFEKTKA